jgi:hypothetical protein
MFTCIVVAYLASAINDYSSLLLIKEFHRHRLCTIHIFFNAFHYFLVDLGHFWAQSFLPTIDSVSSILFLVWPNIFDSHS